jgi:heme oxygenase
VRARESSQWTSVHERLARNTRARHRIAERALNVPLAFSSRENYATLLGRLWSVHDAYEERLAPLNWCSLGVDFASRRRAGWLAEDLMTLGALRPKPIGPLARITTIERALGCLYVLEGSSLGGQILLREALKLPGVSITHGARFLHGHGPQTRAMWSNFLRTLNTYEPSGDAAADIERGALEAFGDFSAALRTQTDRSTSRRASGAAMENHAS